MNDITATRAHPTIMHATAGTCRLLLTLLAAAGLSLAAPSPAAAQSVDSPHGDLSMSCSECHSTEGWTPLLSPLPFQHEITGFHLEAGHRTVRCASCHLELAFAHVGSACADCHLDPHLGELGFACESCHGTTGWDARATVGDLHDATLFPLTGAHRAVDCAACHSEDPPFEFQLTPIDCFACHLEDYQGADLDHVALGFPTTCEDCHSTQAFQPATFGGDGFDHDAFFPLAGAHAALDCNVCHAGGFGGTPSDCFACHADDYEGTTDPNHVAAGFPTSCEDCHGESTWEDAVLDHDAFFPLTGAHRSLDCAECHAAGFPGTPTECVGCHLDDYNQTDDPDHQAAGFPTSCEDCHGTSDWEDADFDHDQLFFPIDSGEHEGEWQSCQDCHVVPSDFGVFECITCHEHDQEDMDDEHDDVAGYQYDSMACYNCHPDGEE